jgi:aryl-alcohol dehydrogenase-like predicted oxidoreductase
MLSEQIPDAAGAGAEVHVYWTLMKGLLAGKITRNHVFAPGDSRPDYDVFQGETRRRVHDAVDELAGLGKETSQTVAQLSIGWALSQPGVSAALVGARRPDQIRETAAARRLDAEVVRRVNAIVARTVASGRPT